MSSSDEAKSEFVKFFTAGYAKAGTLDNLQLAEQIIELEKATRQAKGTLQGFYQVERERKAKLTKEQREWLVTNTDPEATVSEAIEAVKIRRDRMTKADKWKEMAKSLGVEGVDQLAANIGAKATNANLNSFKFNIQSQKRTTISALCNNHKHSDCNGKFNDGESKTCQCDCHAVPAEKSEPFDPSKLFG